MADLAACKSESGNFAKEGTHKADNIVNSIFVRKCSVPALCNAIEPRSSNLEPRIFSYLVADNPDPG